MDDGHSQFEEIARLSPDAKGRVTLGKFAKGISSFRMNVDKEGRILLEPFVEIPARERWLFENEKALASVRRGLADSENGKTKKLGSFARYSKMNREDDAL